MSDQQSSIRILVVEDEKNVGSTLTERLKKEPYHVDWAQTAEDAKLHLSHTTMIWSF